MRLGILHVILLAAVPVLAGCLGLWGGDDWIETSMTVRPSGSVDDDRGSDEYWMVWLAGNRTQDFDGVAPVCSRLPPGFTVYRSNETVTYEEERYDIDPGNLDVLVVVRIEDRSTSCPVTVHLAPNPDPRYVTAVKADWNVTLAVADDGTLTFQETEIPTGSTGVLSFEGDPPGDYVHGTEGTVTATNLGAWDRDDVQAR